LRAIWRPPSLIPACRERGLHLFELGIDTLGCPQLVDLVLERSHTECFGAAFGEVGAALEDLELAERFLGAAAVQ